MKNVNNDMIIWGKDQQEHDENLWKLLQRLEKHELKLNPKKCIFSTDQVLFVDNIVSSNSITPDNKDMIAIQKIAVPTSISELKSFFGIINYVDCYIPNFSTTAEPLWRRTKKEVSVTWTTEQQTAFDSIKALLNNAESMTYYSPTAQIKIIVDANPVGIGAILTQKQLNITFHPISYQSCSLTNAEQRSIPLLHL